MGTLDVLFAVATTVILFLYGLQSFSREIQDLGRDSLKQLLERLTRSRMSGFVLGAVFTAVVQSSSAVSALTVALVDSGAIRFANSLAVMVGANVGTTSTAWLVSFKLTGIGPVFIVLGTLISLMRGPLKVAGKSVFYFGFIFFALDLVSVSLDPLKESPDLPSLLAYATNPLIGGLIGAVLTALVQSSSVVAGLSILLVQQGTIEIQAAVAVIIGANVGSSVTGLIASIPMKPAAKKTALANLYLNLGGVLLFLPFAGQLSGLVTGLSDNPGISVAMAHLIFNVGVAVIALPLLGRLADLLKPDPTDES